jgi:hypothetical protein
MLEELKCTMFFVFAMAILLFAAFGPHSLILSSALLFSVVIIFSLLIVSGLGARELIVLAAVVNFFFYHILFSCLWLFFRDFWK